MKIDPTRNRRTYKTNHVWQIHKDDRPQIFFFKFYFPNGGTPIHIHLFFVHGFGIMEGLRLIIHCGVYSAPALGLSSSQKTNIQYLKSNKNFKRGKFDVKWGSVRELVWQRSSIYLTRWYWFDCPYVVRAPFTPDGPLFILYRVYVLSWRSAAHQNQI